jgi:hypothetical protein
MLSHVVFFFKKKRKRRDGELGSGEEGAENRPPGPPYSGTFSYVQKLMWPTNEVVCRGSINLVLSGTATALESVMTFK